VIVNIRERVKFDLKTNWVKATMAWNLVRVKFRGDLTLLGQFIAR